MCRSLKLLAGWEQDDDTIFLELLKQLLWAHAYFCCLQRREIPLQTQGQEAVRRDLNSEEI